MPTTILYNRTATGEDNYCVAAYHRDPHHYAVRVCSTDCLRCPHCFNRRDLASLSKGIVLCSHPSPRVLPESHWREYLYNIGDLK